MRVIILIIYLTNAIITQQRTGKYMFKNEEGTRVLKQDYCQYIQQEEASISFKIFFGSFALRKPNLPIRVCT